MSTDKEIAAVISEELSVQAVQAEPDLKSQFSQAFMEFFEVLNEWCVGNCRYYRPKPQHCAVRVPGCMLEPLTRSLGKTDDDKKNLALSLARILKFQKTGV